MPASINAHANLGVHNQPLMFIGEWTAVGGLSLVGGVVRVTSGNHFWTPPRGIIRFVYKTPPRGLMRAAQYLSPRRPDPTDARAACAGQLLARKFIMLLI